MKYVITVRRSTQVSAIGIKRYNLHTRGHTHMILVNIALSNLLQEKFADAKRWGGGG